MRLSNYKNICIISSTRADYGILKNLIKKLKKNSKFKLTFVVTGSHLSKKYGNTINEIKKDKIKIDEKIKILSGKNKSSNLLENSSKAIEGYAKVFKKVSPDLLLILGDRYEIFCAAYAAVIFRIPIAHFYGGEITANSYDEYFRHAITKLSNIHFVSTEKYKRRLIQMGEEPRNIFNVGSISLENINKINFLNREQIQRVLKINIRPKLALLTLHPETLNLKATNKQIRETLSAIKSLKNTSTIITMPNDDLNTDKLINSLKNFCKKNNDVHFFQSLGRHMYLSCVNICDFVIGNSSSGIIEVPSIKKYSIDLGKRQYGRERAKSVISCDFNKRKILSSINKIYKYKFNKKITNPYYKKNSLKKIVTVLEKIKIKKIGIKNFYNFGRI